jgi:hypothetical protein
MNMKDFTPEEVTRMIRPDKYTYKGLSEWDKNLLQRDYQQAKRRLQKVGVTVTVKVLLNRYMREEEFVPRYTDKLRIASIVCTESYPFMPEKRLNKKGAL